VGYVIVSSQFLLSFVAPHFRFAKIDDDDTKRHYGSEAIAKVLPPELCDRNKETWCDPFYPETGYAIEIYNGQSGVMIGRTPGLSIRVSRRKLRKLFSEGIDIKVRAHSYTAPYASCT
jgi:hypothetical protein